MQVMENRSLVDAEVIEVAGPDGGGRLRVRLSRVQPVEGFANLLKSLQGDLVDVVVPGGAAEVVAGQRFEAEMSLSRPGRAVLHRMIDPVPRSAAVSFDVLAERSAATVARRSRQGR